jgi:hypothetical protein
VKVKRSRTQARHGGTCLKPQLLRRWRQKDFESKFSQGRVSERPYLQTKYTKDWGLAQVEEHLPGMH